VSGGASYPIERVDDHSLGKRILGSDAKVYVRDGLRRGVDSFSARVNRDQFKSRSPKHTHGTGGESRQEISLGSMTSSTS
jgi:hypothetical protein